MALMGKLDGKRPLWRPGRSWKVNIKMYLQNMGWVHGRDCGGSG